MSSSSEGMRVVRKRLADGTIRTYTYARERRGNLAVQSGSFAAMLIEHRRSMLTEGRAAATLQQYDIYLRHASAAWGHLKPDAIKRSQVLKLRDSLALTSGRGAASVFVRVLSAAFSWAVERELVEHNPASRIKALKGGHLPAWTLDEAEAAMRVLPEAYRRMVLLAMYTGQRRGDLCAMRWSSYDGTSIRLVQAKTASALVIPVHPRLRLEMDQWRNTAASTHILTGQNNKPLAPASLSVRIRRLLDEAGFASGLNVHGLRKLAATMLADAGCSTHEIAAITGHRTLGMVALYTRSADQERLASSAIVRLQTVRENRRKLAG